MAHEFFAWELLLLEHRWENMDRRARRREWRNNHDPFICQMKCSLTCIDLAQMLF